MSDSLRLAHDSFERWRTAPGALSLAARQGFTYLAFDRPGSNGLGGLPPRFALWAEGENGIVAVESQHRAHLTPKPAGAVGQYFDRVDDKRRSSPLMDDMKRMAGAADYMQLDAVALIKAYAGLARDGRDATLLYLFWEPAHSTPESLRHRAEVAAFAQAANLPGTGFAAMSYDELWNAWAQQAAPAWARAHASALRKRYTAS